MAVDTKRKAGKGARISERELEWRNEQRVRTSCADCDWTFEGAAFDAREQAAEHRRRNHPGRPYRTPKPKRRRDDRVPLTDLDIERIAERIRGGERASQIARDMFQAYGFKSAAACQASISAALKRRGLPTTPEAAGYVPDETRPPKAPTVHAAPPGDRPDPPLAGGDDPAGDGAAPNGRVEPASPLVQAAIRVEEAQAAVEAAREALAVAETDLEAACDDLRELLDMDKAAT
jgi:hypothetical protein